MIRKISLVSISVLATIIIAGCHKHSKQNELPKVSPELKSLAKSPRSNTGLEELPMPTELKELKSMSEEKECQNGGMMKFSTDVNRTAIMQSPNDFNITMISEAVNCIQNDIVANGKMQMLINRKGEQSTITTTFLTDFNLSDSKSETVIKKESFFVEQGDISTESMEIISDGQRYRSINLKTHEVTDDNGVTTSYDISGKEMIDGKIFIVDERYDASKTPMVTDASDVLQKGGKMRYTNEQNHTIWFEAIDLNKIQISVDEDGDGKIDTQEIIDY